MSAFEALTQTAALVRRAALEPLIERADASPRKAAENRVIYRAAMASYLAELQSALIDIVPSEALEPLGTLASAITSIENFGADPPLFIAGEMPFGLTKPVRRLQAEGNAVGCAAYLHETVSFGIMDACRAVASLFSYLGHSGRTAQGQIGDGKRLSSKTLHQWYNELLVKPEDGGLAWEVRRAAKDRAIDLLTEMERKNPTELLPREDARMKLAQRMGHIAMESLIAAPSGPSWQLKLKRNSGSKS